MGLMSTLMVFGPCLDCSRAELSIWAVIWGGLILCTHLYEKPVWVQMINPFSTSEKGTPHPSPTHIPMQRKCDSGLKAIKNFKTPIYYLSQLSPSAHSALKPTLTGIGNFFVLKGFGKLMKALKTLSRKSTDTPTHTQVVVRFQVFTDPDHEPQVSKL